MNVKYGMITVFVVRPDASGKSHELLQLFRSPGTWHGRTWQVVRGKVEEGESFISAALRELKEETGLRPLEFFRIGSVETFYTSIGDTVWHSVPFCAMIDRTQTIQLNREHTEMRWVMRDEMERKVMWAGEVRLLHDLYRDILDYGVAREHLKIELPPA
ncbi:MAG TPA: NUDIX domain-containing protein [Tepidisphaeraceae bacterium]|nr:NUDIX domain-containing protein [Tepidisphaeraceae bacterium]